MEENDTIKIVVIVIITIIITAIGSYLIRINSLLEALIAFIIVVLIIGGYIVYDLRKIQEKMGKKLKNLITSISESNSFEEVKKDIEKFIKNNKGSLSSSEVIYWIIIGILITLFLSYLLFKR